MLGCWLRKALWSCRMARTVQLQQLQLPPALHALLALLALLGQLLAHHQSRRHPT